MAVEFINSNIALFGTELERKVKETSAQSEKAWHEVVHGDSLLIWRIEKFRVVAWPRDLYGSFHVGDSYIVLKRVGDHEPYAYNLHFWLGGESTVDERGAAAYKTVELDTFLSGVPVQYRELQNSESALFRSYFENGIYYLAGGVETGFRHVDPDEYANWTQRVVPVAPGSNIRVVDNGRVVELHMPVSVSAMQKYRAVIFVQNMLLHRPEVAVEQVYE